MSEKQTATSSPDGSSRRSRGDPGLDKPFEASESRGSTDEDVKIAKEMALAIQNNPDLTPAELRDLMAQAEARRAASLKTPSRKSPLLKQISKNVKSSVKKAFKPGSAQSTPDRDTSEAVPRSSVRLGDFVEGSVQDERGSTPAIRIKMSSVR